MKAGCLIQQELTFPSAGKPKKKKHDFPPKLKKAEQESNNLRLIQASQDANVLDIKIASKVPDWRWRTFP